MAALRDIARDFAAEIRDGIGWTIVYAAKIKHAQKDFLTSQGIHAIID